MLQGMCCERPSPLPWVHMDVYFYRLCGISAEGRGAEPVPGAEGGCPGDNMKYSTMYGFGSELFFDKLACFKLQPISYEDPLLHKLLKELLFIEIRPITAELFSVLSVLPSLTLILTSEPIYGSHNFKA
jgi:hypothetical protein